MCFFLYCYCAGVPQSTVTNLVEQHMTEMVVKHFDPKKADSIFNSDGNVSVNHWVFLC